MSTRRFIEYTQDQDFLLPPSLLEWLPKGHLAHFVSDVLDVFDLSEWERAYATDNGSGAPPFPPRMMLKILVYGYATGVFSSRKLESKCLEDIAFMYLAGMHHPDFRSIIKFRKRHLARFNDLFVQIVLLARESGLASLGRVGIDGSKFKANASKHKAMSYQHMCEQEEKLKAEIAEILRRAAETDETEDKKHGDYNGYSLPDALSFRQGRLDTIQAAKARIEERARERAELESERREEEAQAREAAGEKPKKYRKEPDSTPKSKEQENFTDPESRIMRDGATKGFVQGYNTQVAVDSEHQIIVAATLNNQASDSQQLVPVIEAVKETAGAYPDEAMADAGYKSEANFATLESDAYTTNAYVACGRETYDPRAVCPEGPLPETASATERMDRKLKTEEGRAIYKTRKHVVEPVFGWIKNVLGFRQFSLRGQENAEAEWKLVCGAMNLRRMARIMG
jgi:transposase